MKYMLAILVTAVLLSACLIDEIAPVDYADLTMASTSTVVAIPTSRLATSDPILYPTVDSNHVPALGYFTPFRPVAVFETIAMQNSIDMLVPGNKYPFTSELTMSGKITFLCVRWNTTLGADSFGWDCTGWALANGNGIYYGEIMYYGGRATPTRVISTPTSTPIAPANMPGDGTPRIVITWIVNP